MDFIPFEYENDMAPVGNPEKILNTPENIDEPEEIIIQDSYENNSPENISDDQESGKSSVFNYENSDDKKEEDEKEEDIISDITTTINSGVSSVFNYNNSENENNTPNNISNNTPNVEKNLLNINSLKSGVSNIIKNNNNLDFINIPKKEKRTLYFVLFGVSLSLWFTRNRNIQISSGSSIISFIIAFYVPSLYIIYSIMNPSNMTIINKNLLKELMNTEECNIKITNFIK